MRSETEGRRAQAARERLRPITSLYPFQPRFFLHGEVAQHFVDEGPHTAGPNETLLFVHGNPTWSFAFRRAIGHFSKTHRCVAVDHIGCGLSDKPRDASYRLEDHVERLERLVLFLDLRSITLVLHDWGGAIGFGFARRHPGRIARIVLSNTAAFPGGRLPLRIAACRIPLFGTLAVRGLNGFARAATHVAVKKPLAPLVKRGYLLPYDSWGSRVATHEFVRDIPRGPSHPSWSELSATGKAVSDFDDRPTLLLWGEKDWCFTPRFREQWEQRLPSAEVHRFDHAGHYLFEDEADAYVERIETFLARSAPPAPGSTIPSETRP